MQANGCISRWISLFALVCLAVFAAGCASVNNNFSRIENEPAPLPSEVRAGFGVVGVLAIPHNDAIYPPQDDSATSVNARSSPPIVLTVAQSFSKETPHEVHAKTSGRHETKASSNASTHTEGHTKTDDNRSDKNGGHERSSRTENNHSDHSGGMDEFKNDIASGLAGIAVEAAAGAVFLMVDSAIQHAMDTAAHKGADMLQKAAAADPMEIAIQTRLQQLAKKQGTNRIVSLPASLGADLAKNDYKLTVPAGVDSVLLIRMTGERFIVEGPGSTRLESEARISVIRTRDGAVLHAGFLDYCSRSRSLSDWSAHNANRLKDERRQEQELFAKCLSEQLFGFDTPSVSRVSDAR